MIVKLPWLQTTALSPLTALVFTILFTLIYFFGAHQGSYYFDDYSYGLYAFEINEGTFQFNKVDPFNHRLMNILPVALIYKLFGISAYTTSLWPFLCTIGSLLLIYLTFAKEYPLPTFFALIFLGINFHVLFVSNYLYPDNPAMFFSLAATLVLYKYYQTNKSAILSGSLFVTLAFLATLAKETAMYALVFYMLVFIHDLIKRKNYRFWVSAWITGIVLMLLYFSMYYFITGEALFRFTALKSVDQFYTKPEELQNWDKILPRLTYRPLLFFISSAFAAPFVFLISLCISTERKKLMALSNTIGFFFLAFLSGLCLFWFGSISFAYYKPMDLVPRMFSPVLPALCIAGGFGAAFILKNRMYILLAAGFFLLIVFLASANLRIVYGLIFLGLVLTCLVSKINFSKKFYTFVFPAFLILALSLWPMHFIRKPSLTGYFQEKEIFENYLNDASGKYVVFSNIYLSRHGRSKLYYDYQPNQNYEFVEYGLAPSDAINEYNKAYVLINNAFLENPELQLKIREKDILEMYPKHQLVAEKGEVKLFLLK